jgi:hypothetical protein
MRIKSVPREVLVVWVLVLGGVLPDVLLVQGRHQVHKCDGVALISNDVLVDNETERSHLPNTEGGHSK